MGLCYVPKSYGVCRYAQDDVVAVTGGCRSGGSGVVGLTPLGVADGCGVHVGHTMTLVGVANGRGWREGLSMTV